MGFNEMKNGWLLLENALLLSYPILVNRQPKDFIKPTRGIRQDSLSSYFFFLLCMEGFHGLISKIAIDGDIKGLSISR